MQEQVEELPITIEKVTTEAKPRKEEATIFAWEDSETPMEVVTKAPSAQINTGTSCLEEEVHPRGSVNARKEEKQEDWNKKNRF